MKILALDQSTLATGYSVFKGDKLIDYGLITPTKSTKITDVSVVKAEHSINIKMPEYLHKDTLNRITQMSDVIESLIKNYKPDVVYFEEVYENANPKGFRSLARLQGFIACVCHKYKTPYRIVAATVWRTVWGNYSQKTTRAFCKKDVMKKVNEKFGTNFVKDDVSDAVGIGWYAVNTF